MLMLRFCARLRALRCMIAVVCVFVPIPLYAQDSANVSTVKAIYAAFGKGDLQTVLDSLADNVMWEVIGPASDCTCYGPRQGKVAVAEFFKMGSERHDYKAFEPREFFSSGDVVIVVGSQTLAIRTTKREFKSDWVHVIRVAQGKMVSFREFTDTASYLQASR